MAPVKLRCSVENIRRIVLVSFCAPAARALTGQTADGRLASEFKKATDQGHARHLLAAEGQFIRWRSSDNQSKYTLSDCDCPDGCRPDSFPTALRWRENDHHAACFKTGKRDGTTSGKCARNNRLDCASPP